MADYTELVKELRYESSWREDYPEDKRLLLQAADAIEFLQTYKVAFENIISIGGWWLVGQDRNLHSINVPMNWPPKGTKTVKVFPLPTPPKENT